MRKILTTLAFYTAFTIQAWAVGLIVVGDFGGALTPPYYQGLNPQPSATTSGPDDLSVRGSGVFPVRSIYPSSGQVRGHTTNTLGLQPLLLVGNGTLSRAWLKERGNKPRDLHAMGLAVNVAGEACLTEIRAQGKGLQILPAPADDLVGQFGLRHYPALIAPTAIQQQEPP